MENTDLFVNLFYNFKESNFKIKTNVKEDKINEVLEECYRSTLDMPPDYRDPIEKDIYNISIKLDLSYDNFNISYDTGNRVFAYELIRTAIDNWEILSPEVDLSKEGLEKIIFKKEN